MQAVPKFPINEDVADGLYSPALSATRQKKWLLSSSAWTDLPWTEWTPIKVLGAGSHGLCGLWKYTGPRAGYSGPDNVVVKQVVRGTAYDLQTESRLMRNIMSYSASWGGTRHIVRLLKAFHYDPGAGTSPIDPAPYDINYQHNNQLDVGRIYIEYCVRGDLDLKVRELEEGKPWKEEEVWRLLECLARALLALETGSENLLARSWGLPKGVAHFDIKPQNIFIGEHNEKHPRLHSFKLGDFGLALEVPNQVNGRPWKDQAQGRGTGGYYSPEQIYQDYDIDMPTNIWSLGCVMHQIMRYQGQEDPLQRWYENPLGTWKFVQTMFEATTPTVTDNLPFYTFGIDLLEETLYSKHLIEIVHACLAYIPADRPTAAHVLRLAQLVLLIFDQMNARTAQNPDRGGPMELGEGPGVPVPARPPRSLRRFTGAERETFRLELARPAAPRPDAAAVRWPQPAAIPGVPRAPVNFPTRVRRVPPILNLRRTGRNRNPPRRYPQL